MDGGHRYHHQADTLWQLPGCNSHAVEVGECVSRSKLAISPSWSLNDAPETTPFSARSIFSISPFEPTTHPLVNPKILEVNEMNLTCQSIIYRRTIQKE